MNQEETFRARAKSVRHAARAHLLEIRRTRLAKRAGPLPCFAPGDIGSSKAEFAHLHLREGPQPKAEAVRMPLISMRETGPFAVTAPTPSLADADLTQANDSELLPFVDTTLAEPPRVLALSNNDSDLTLRVLPAKPKRKTVTTVANKRPKQPKTKDSASDPDASEALVEDIAVFNAAKDSPEDAYQQNIVPDPSSLAEPEREDGYPLTANAGSPCALADAPSVSDLLPEFETLPSQSMAKTCSLRSLPGAGPGLIWMLGTAGIATMDDLADADAEVLGTRLGLVGQILNVGSWVDFARDSRRANAGVSRLTHLPSL